LLPQQAASQDEPENIWPFPFIDLDPELAANVGYNAYKTGSACCWGTVEGLLKQWKDLYGGPFNGIPGEMFRYGAGGVAGWGATCGTINGAAAMINLVCDHSTASALINELVAWYADTELPIYAPEGQEAMETSAAHSPLCHASVGRWCEAAQKSATSSERAERCARLVGDVAKKTSILLNDHFNDIFVPEHGVSEGATQCLTCHGSSGQNNANGKMECTSCHAPSLHPLPIGNWEEY
ncbi:C-GCAxxG-C-C family protein, partial [bacterium]|nr:C-GCAxxG-C-C family protein [bacterium]